MPYSACTSEQRQSTIIIIREKERSYKLIRFHEIRFNFRGILYIVTSFTPCSWAVRQEYMIHGEVSNEGAQQDSHNYMAVTGENPGYSVKYYQMAGVSCKQKATIPWIYIENLTESSIINSETVSSRYISYHSTLIIESGISENSLTAISTP